MTRACTLWFAVALGLPALIAYARRKHVHVEDVGARADADPTTTNDQR